MTRPRPKSFHDQIVEELGAKIVSGVLASGTQVSPEPILAESLGVGRLAVREAMKVLAAKGLIVIRPKTGTHVLPREAWNLFDPAVLRWHAAASFDDRFLADLVQLRRMIEPPAARLAAVQATDAQIEAVRSAHAAMAAATAQEDYIAADLRFHAAVLAACNNQFIRQLQGAISEVLKISFTASSAPGGRQERLFALSLHEALVTALVQRDGDAAEAAVQRLIERAEDRIRGARQAAGAAKAGPAAGSR
ncbi:MAG TPA: FadR/GntR family transcriptional regulator [Ideonella sp.]|nr:FadR/GntR family transcriptional regulator [Ideonella sp.]